MSRQMPQNAKSMRELLAQYLEACKAHMTGNSDKVWVQGEIDRYRGQIYTITHGVKRESKKKHTGIVRKIDELGRIVVPKELRNVYEIPEGTPLEIFLDEDTMEIILQKYEPSCHFCNENAQDITLFRGRRICETCLEELFNQV